MNSENIKEIRAQFYHAINATPFSERGRAHLAELNIIDSSKSADFRKIFLKKVYVQPFTAYDTPYDEQTDDEEAEIVFGKKAAAKADRQRQKERFEDDLIYGKESIFMLMGTAGSGKTTYLNYLFECVLSSKHKNMSELIILDIENAQEVRKILHFCSAVCNFSKEFDSLAGRFISAVIFQLNRFLRKNNENLDDYKMRILELAMGYSKKFQSDETKELPPDMPKVTDFFGMLEKFALNGDTYEDFGEKINDFIHECSKSSHKEKIETLFLIFLRVLLCQHNESANSRPFYTLAIDNIERLIDEESPEPIIVQENELKEVLNAVQSAVASTNSILNESNDSLKKSLEPVHTKR